MSLRSRIALIATLLVLAAISVNTLLQTFAARRAVLQQAQDGGDSIAETLARAAAFAEEVPRQVEEEIGQQMQAQAALVAQLVAIAEQAGLSATSAPASILPGRPRSGWSMTGSTSMPGSPCRGLRRRGSGRFRSAP